MGKHKYEAVTAYRSLNWGLYGGISHYPALILPNLSSTIHCICFT